MSLPEHKQLPAHIAIIPDGNRRWAEQKGMSRQEGYAIGIRKIGDVLKWCKESEIRMLSMWGFSTDNFNRDHNEISGLFGLFKENLKKALESDEKNKHDVKVRFFGRIGLFPKEIQDMIRKAEEISANNNKYQLNLFLSYGGREEIVDAVNAILKNEQINKQTKNQTEINEKEFEKFLYTSGVPDPDLIIRTSGEQRLSGFLPWQAAYSELYFCKNLWPDFSKKDFEAALTDYTTRQKRFGK